jgi:hypothetical protein
MRSIKSKTEEARIKAKHRISEGLADTRENVRALKVAKSRLRERVRQSKRKDP